MSTIAGIPLSGGSSGQFALLPDFNQAFNTTGYYLDLTRSVPIVNELATNAERAALGTNQPTVLQTIVGNLGTPQYSSTIPSSIMQAYTGMSLDKAHNILGISPNVQQQPSQTILNYPKIENVEDKDTKVSIYTRDKDDDYTGPPGLRRTGGIPPGQVKHRHWNWKKFWNRHEHHNNHDRWHHHGKTHGRKDD